MQVDLGGLRNHRQSLHRLACFGPLLLCSRLQVFKRVFFDRVEVASVSLGPREQLQRLLALDLEHLAVGVSEQLALSADGLVDF